MRRDQWLRIRQQGIGSSDASAAIGICPFKSPLKLWMEKTNRATQPDLAENEAIYFGSLLEPLVAAEYAKRSGNKVRRVNAVLQHPQHAFMLANLDREIIGCPDGPGVLEVKTAGHFAAKHWEDGVPFYYETQVMHQLAVTNREWADVPVLIGGQEYRCYRIQRDEEIIREVIKLEAEFWSFVTNNVQPPADGSESAAKTLAHLYPRDFGESVDFSNDAKLNEFYARVLQAREQKDHAEQLEEFHKQKLQEAMGQATKAIFAGGSVTWKRTKDGVAIDLEKMKREQTELVNQYEVLRPGYRRFSVQTQ